MSTIRIKQNDDVQLEIGDSTLALLWHEAFPKGQDYALHPDRILDLAEAANKLNMVVVRKNLLALRGAMTGVAIVIDERGHRWTPTVKPTTRLKKPAPAQSPGGTQTAADPEKTLADVVTYFGRAE